MLKTADIAKLFSKNVEVELVDLAAPPTLIPLAVDEQRSLGEVAAEKRLEFQAGRHCAKIALRRLGMNDVTIPRRDNRLPQWPSGVVGCISHSQQMVAAAVAKQSTPQSLGLDLQIIEMDIEKVLRRIAVGREINKVTNEDNAARCKHVALLFSAKECFYKCQFPLTNEHRIGFHDLSVTIDWQQKTFTVVCQVQLHEKFSQQLSGRWFIADDAMVVTALELTR